jgi:hypothetical protein
MDRPQHAADDSADALVLIEQATRRSAVVWVGRDDPDRAAAVWHLWHGASAYVLTGGPEQPWPGLPSGRRALVVVRSKDRQNDRVVQWEADVELVPPGGPEWDEVVPLLRARRLNPAADQPVRWPGECELRRLTPTGRVVPVAR